MTFLATVSMGDCVILAADRTVFDGNGLVHESARKITKTKYGYITAAGFVELIEPVKARFQTENPETVNDMEELIKNEQIRFLARYGGSPAAIEWIKRSSWKITFPAGGYVRSAFYTPAGMAGVLEGKSMLTFPNSVSETEKKTVETIAKEQFRYRVDSGKTSREDANRNILAIMKIVDFLRAQGHSVSEGIDFAVHHLDWRQELTSEHLL